MNIKKTKLENVVVIEPEVYTDDRGYFFESFNRLNLETKLNRKLDFVQVNQSQSEGKVLRGLHYQIKNTQAKLIRVVVGSILDVAVDLRRGSSTFGEYVMVELSASNFKQLWIPEGFAHGFLTMSNHTIITYSVNDYYSPKHDRVIDPFDSDIGIPWPIEDMTLSDRDRAGTAFANAEYF